MIRPGQGCADGCKQGRQAELGQGIADSGQGPHKGHLDVADFTGWGPVLQHHQVQACYERKEMDVGVEELNVFL